MEASKIIFRDVPPAYKCVHIKICDSITDTEILAVVSALQGCKASAVMKHNTVCIQSRTKQELFFSMRIDMSDLFIAKGLPDLLSKVLDCDFTINEGSLDNVLITQDLNIVNITDLATPSGRSLAQAAGILIGSESGTIVDLTKVVADLVFLNLNDRALVVNQFVLQNRQEIPRFLDALLYYSWFVNTDDNEDTLVTYNDMLKDVVRASIVIGPPSFYTYAASCLGIPCIEILETRNQLAILSKWSSIKYTAILEEELEHLSIERLEKLWSNWNSLVELPDKEYAILGGADGA